MTRSFVLGLALSIAASSTVAQSYPDKLITITVPFAPGGDIDTVARTLSGHLAGRLKQTVIIDNVAGAAGTIGTAKLAGAPPDGYRLLYSVESTMVVAELVTPATVKYDGLKDFAPIALVASAPLMVVAKPSFPASNLQEFLSLVKAAPGKYSYGTSGIGTSLHLAAERLAQKAGLSMVHAPYKLGPQIITDLIGDQIDLAVMPLPSVLPYAKKVKILFSLTDRRIAELPGVDAAGDQPATRGIEVLVWHGLFAPAATPPAVVDRLNREVNAALREPAVLRVLKERGMQPGGGAPADLRQHMQADKTRYAAIVKSLNLKLD